MGRGDWQATDHVVAKGRQDWMTKHAYIHAILAKCYAFMYERILGLVSCEKKKQDDWSKVNKDPEGPSYINDLTTPLLAPSSLCGMPKPLTLLMCISALLLF